VVINWLKQLDELLRGERIRGDLLLSGRIDLRLRTFVPIAVALGAIYGFFMGWYALLHWGDHAVQQALATTIKLPLLFLLTLGVTFPSLYVFNALVGCRMTFPATIRILVGAIVVNLAVGASLGPILGFFTLSTTSYSFMVLLNVALLGIAGLVSVGFLLRALRALARSRAYEEAAREASQAAASPPPPPLPPQAYEPPPAHTPLNTPPTAPPIAPSFQRIADHEDPAQAAYRARSAMANAAARRTEQSVSRRERTANFILTIWVFIYMLVGSQMGWILRPFIGSPDVAFHWLRPREGSFFIGAFGALRHFLGW
jgi:hypothetical protein